MVETEHWRPSRFARAAGLGAAALTALATVLTLQAGSADAAPTLSSNIDAQVLCPFSNSAAVMPAATQFFYTDERVKGTVSGLLPNHAYYFARTDTQPPPGLPADKFTTDAEGVLNVTEGHWGGTGDIGVGSRQPFYIYDTDSTLIGEGATEPATDDPFCSPTLQKGALRSSLIASNSAYRLLAQSDGNLVLYTKAGKALWQSHSYGHPNARTELQSDGNLVTYATNRAVLWQSHTAGHPSSYNHPGTYLIMQTDGNLVLYTPLGRPLWQTHTYA